MKTTLAIVFALLVVGLVAGFVVPPESRSDASLAVAAEQPNAEQPPNRIASNRGRGSDLPIANDSASNSAPPPPVLTTPAEGAAVPLADILGVAGLLGGAAATLLLLQGRNPDGGQRAVRSEAPRHQP